MARKERRGAALYVCVVLLRPLLMVLTRRLWRGQEHLPAGGFVLAANHISHTDPLLFAHFVHDAGYAPRYLAKASVLDLPVVGRLLRASGQIPVYRESGTAAQAYRNAVRAVGAGRSVIVYPEGTLTRDPGLWPMVGKTGAARIALESGCSVVPAAQWGAHELLAPYGRWPRFYPRPVNQVLVGPPVDLADLRGRPMTTDVMAEATERIMAAIADLLGELRGEPPPPVRFDPRQGGLPVIGNPARRRPHPGTSGDRP